MRPELIYNQLGMELKQIEDQIRQLKQRQFTGTDTVQTYHNVSPAVAAGGWDIDWTPTWAYTSGSSRAIDLSVLFTSAEQAAPVSNMTYEILIDNTHWYQLGSFDDPDHDVAVNAYVHDSFLSYAEMLPQPRKDAWYFNVTAYRSGVNVKVRFFVDSTDIGDVSVVNI